MFPQLVHQCAEQSQVVFCFLIVVCFSSTTRGRKRSCFFLLKVYEENGLLISLLYFPSEEM